MKRICISNDIESAREFYVKKYPRLRNWEILNYCYSKESAIERLKDWLSRPKTKILNQQFLSPNKPNRAYYVIGFEF